MTTEDFARAELETELRNKLDTFIRLAGVSRRAIEREQQNIANYTAQIKVLRESLRNLKSPQVQEARTMTREEAERKAAQAFKSPSEQETYLGALRNFLQDLKTPRAQEAETGFLRGLQRKLKSSRGQEE